MRQVRTLVIYFAIWHGSAGFSVNSANRKQLHTERSTCKDYVSVVGGRWVIKPKLGHDHDPLIRVLGGGGQESQDMLLFTPGTGVDYFRMLQL